MRSCARSNTALFRTGGKWQRSGPTNLPRRDALAATASWCAAAPWADERCCAIVARAAASASGCKAAAGTARKRLGLDAQRRLREKAQFERLLRHGEKRSHGGYTCYLERRSEGPPRLGILISRKHAAAAADRNRIKRCIREAFRLEQEKIGPLDLLVRPPYGGHAPSVGRLRELLCRLSA